MTKIGVFIPIGSRGWLMSTTSPKTMPSFDLNRTIVQRAEFYGLDFALSMIKLRGYDGPSEYWVHNLESFTLMAGIAAVTRRIQLFASVAVLTMPPALVARMATTIDSIAPGRFGVNIVTGWQPKEYQQMGLWPGDAHFARRYDYVSEYVQIMRDLWTTGYGEILLVKIGLVCTAVAWGGVHRTLIRPRLPQASDRFVAQLGRSLVGESVVAIAILLVAAILVDSNPPPRPFLTPAAQAVAARH